jgi:hypothetical protein
MGETVGGDGGAAGKQLGDGVVIPAILAMLQEQEQRDREEREEAADEQQPQQRRQSERPPPCDLARVGSTSEEELSAPALRWSRQYSSSIVRMMEGPDTAHGGVLVSWIEKHS